MEAMSFYAEGNRMSEKRIKTHSVKYSDHKESLWLETEGNSPETVCEMNHIDEDINREQGFKLAVRYNALIGLNHNAIKDTVEFIERVTRSNEVSEALKSSAVKLLENLKRTR